MDSVEFAKAEIAKQIEALEKKPREIETPISIAIDLKFLRQSDNPEERSLAEILSSLTEIKTELANVQKFGLVDRDRMAMTLEKTTYQMYDMQKEFSHRLEAMLEEQRVLFENLKVALRASNARPSSQEKKP